jgi:hypothetical protein
LHQEGNISAHASASDEFLLDTLKVVITGIHFVRPFTNCTIHDKRKTAQRWCSVHPLLLFGVV